MHSNFRKTTLILATILNTLLVPLILFCFVLPIFVWRMFVLCLAKLFRKDFLTSTPLLANLFTFDNIFAKPRINLLAVLQFNGPISFMVAKERLGKLISSGKRSELQCCLTKWLGVFFLQKCDTFKLEEHLMENKGINYGAEFEALVDSLLQNKVWKEGKPLWEFHVLPNHKDTLNGTSSSIIFLFHHSIMDGVSLHHLARDFCDQDLQLEAEVASFMERVSISNGRKGSTFWTMAITLPYLLFITPFTSIYKTLEAYEENLLTPSYEQRTGKTVAHSVTLELSWLKSLARKTGQSVSALLTEALTFGIRNHFLTKTGKDPTSDIHAIFNRALPNHPGKRKLTNHFFPDVINLPTSQPNRSQRARIIHGQLSKSIPTIFAETLFTKVFLLLSGFINLKFPFFSSRRQRCSLIFATSIIPGNRHFQFCGAECVRIFCPPRLVLGPPNNPGFPILFYTLGYAGKVVLCMAADTKLFPDKAACEKFMDNFLQGLYEVEQSLEIPAAILTNKG